MIEEQEQPVPSPNPSSQQKGKRRRYWCIGIATLLLISMIAVSIIVATNTTGSPKDDDNTNANTGVNLIPPDEEEDVTTTTSTTKDALLALEDKCDIPLVNVTGGLSLVSEEFQDMREILENYSDLTNAGFRHRGLALHQSSQHQNHDERELLFGLLVAGVAKVATLATKAFVFSKKAAPALSSLADVLTIGSTAASLFGKSDDGGSGGSDLEEVKVFFDQVFDRFDSIDSQLGNIQDLVQEGFEELSIVINEGFAKQELDNWINFHLKDLMDDYRNYMNPDHSPETRKVYEDAFRTSCQDTHAPLTIFRFLYSNTCSSCDNEIGGRSNQYILDTFIDRAKADFDTNEERVLWFRKSFSTLMIGAMVETYYLHSVCLYQSPGVCPNHDPVWLERLDLMASAMVESAESISLSENLLINPLGAFVGTFTTTTSYGYNFSPLVVHSDGKISIRGGFLDYEMTEVEGGYNVVIPMQDGWTPTGSSKPTKFFDAKVNFRHENPNAFKGSIRPRAQDGFVGFNGQK